MPRCSRRGSYKPSAKFGRAVPIEVQLLHRGPDEEKMKKLLIILSIMFAGCVDCNCGPQDDNLLDFEDSVESAKDVTQDKDE